MKKVLTCARFWPVAVWFFFNIAVFFSYGGLWGGPYLMHIYGMTKAQAGNVLSMLAFGMIVGSPVLSFLSNRVFRGRKPVLIISSFIVLGLTTLLAFRTDALSLLALYLITLGIGVFSSAVVVIGFTTAKELFPVQMAGTSVGLINLFPFAGGAVFQPLLGYVIERQGKVDEAFTLAGYEQAFLILFFCSVIALLASFFLKETLARDGILK